MDVFANLVLAGQELAGSRIPCRLVFGNGLRFGVDRELIFSPTTHSADNVEVCFYTAAIGGEAVARLWVGSATVAATVTIRPGNWLTQN